MKPYILIDFSKVLSPMGISRHLASNLKPIVTLEESKIRELYKKDIGSYVTGDLSISCFIDAITPHLQPGHSIDSIKKALVTVPPIDREFLDFLQSFRLSHRLVLVSDIFPELGEALKKELVNYFDDFIFSYELGVKKSQDIFWKKLQKKIEFTQTAIFIDDKEENVCLAEKYGIRAIVYSSFSECKNRISRIITS